MKIISAFKKTPGFQPEDELNADATSSFRGNHALKSVEDVKQIMKNLFLIIQIVASLLVILFILIQGKGAGLESGWSGSGDIFRTKRGAEKIIFIITIAVALIFLLSSLANILIG